MASQNRFILSKYGITHICTIGTGLNPKYPTLYTYLHVSELDTPGANLRKHFEKCTAFINQAIAEGGKVLVHCYAGISRSSTIVIQYLMKEYGMKFAQAHLHVRNQRWFICPNPGFKKQLLAFEKELKNIESQPKEIPVKFLIHQL